MEVNELKHSSAELRQSIKRLVLINCCLVVIILVMALQSLMREQIVILRTPGVVGDEVFARTTVDRASQIATLKAVTNNLAQCNPSSKAFCKDFLQSYLSPAAYTKVSAEIDANIKRLELQRELGSYYFVFTSYQYDTALNKHFVLGEVHTVNAAIDRAEPWVFEYQVHYENYRLAIDDVKSYKGTQPQNSAWLKQQQEIAPK
jgi:TraE protein